MKKIFFAIVIISCSYGILAYAQEDTKTSISTKSVSASEVQMDKVIATLETAKNGQIDIGKTAEQLSKEKQEIEQQKNMLVNNVSAVPAEAPEVKKQIKLLEKQQQLIEAKEMAISERIQATEQVMAIIERKIFIINNEDLTLNDIRHEARLIRKAMKADEKERDLLVGQIPLLNMEIKATEKELVGQKMLLELKEEGKPAIKDSIKTNEMRLESVKTELALTDERIAFVNVQIETAKDYLIVLWEKRLDIMEKMLFVPKLYSFSYVDVLMLLFIAACFVFRHKAFKKICFVGIISSAVYFIMSFIGYHKLALYIISRIALIGIVAVILLSFQRLIKILFQKIISFETEGSKEQTMTKTVLAIVRTILGWSLSFFGVFIFVELLGLRHETLDLVLEIIRKPFYVLGEVNISIWLLLKVTLVFWMFIAGGNLIDSLLRKNVYKRLRLDESVQYTFSVTIKYLMILVGVLVALSTLGVKLAALTVFAGTLGIGIGFGLQDIAKNFISGIVMLIERPVKVGDYVEVSGLPGKVKDIKARSTIVNTFDNISVIVPNSEFMSQKVINWSYSDKLTRLKIPIGVAYGTDPELVKTTLLDAGKSNPDVIKKPAPYVWFTQFGESSLDFELYVWTDDPNNRFNIKSQINFEINRLFNEKGIKIPFPQRDIHIKSKNVNLE
ncbi:MAG: mechanosensitive ion channel [Candidatus Omnitrophica bacterium]|nr:mechanosensitive ion channel [Candidatus Omnitrophota bacterium]